MQLVGEADVGEDKPGFKLPKWWLAHPLIGFIGTLASVIGIPLCLVLFFLSQQDRDVRYAVSSTPTTIVKAGQTSNLKVQFNNRELTSDVSSIQIAIWNAGKESVRRENILSETLSLRLEPATTVLEARVKKMTRDLVAFQVGTSNSSMGILTMSWNILERGDGALLEVIYTGTSERVVIDGAIEGRMPIRRVMLGVEANIVPVPAMLALVVLSILMGLTAAVREYRKQGQTDLALCSLR